MYVGRNLDEKMNWNELVLLERLNRFSRGILCHHRVQSVRDLTLDQCNIF
jgi:hypothetical protein